jgi:hypothetical protein
MLKSKGFDIGQLVALRLVTGEEIVAVFQTADSDYLYVSHASTWRTTAPTGTLLFSNYSEIMSDIAVSKANIIATGDVHYDVADAFTAHISL